MSKRLMSIVVFFVLLVSLSVVFASQGDEPRGRKVGPRISDRESRRGQADQAREKYARRGQDRIAKQIKTLEQEHATIVGELKEILSLAEQEGAPKTAGRVEKLIDSLTKSHKEAVDRLEKTKGRMTQRRRRPRQNPRDKDRSPKDKNYDHGPKDKDGDKD